MAIYITGDTHGKFHHIAEFCNDMKTTTRDTIIILGDAGINYYNDPRDTYTKDDLSEIPITFFCIHGNHEIRPEKLSFYETETCFGNNAFFEKKYPNIWFAKDGTIYDIGGKKTFVCGGAYSVDKFYRLSRGWNWFPDEQPNERIKQLCENVLELHNWKVDRVLTHTCPYQYIPREMFLSGIDQSTVDNSTELWLEGLENRLKYEKWCCGHYHTDKKIDKIQFLYHNIMEW